jgi:hypothetical protein
VESILVTFYYFCFFPEIADQLEAHSAACPVNYNSCFLKNTVVNSRLMQKLSIMGVQDKFNFHSLNFFTNNKFLIPVSWWILSIEIIICFYLYTMFWRIIISASASKFLSLY